MVEKKALAEAEVMRRYGSGGVWFFFFSSRRRHTRLQGDWSSDVCSSDLLIGADGVHSRIRQALFGPDRPSFTGIIAWRGVIPMDRLPERMARSVGTNWIGPGGHVVHYPVRAGSLMNFVGALERADWQVESWSTRGTTEEMA